MSIPTVSICIPTFELGGRGIPMLTKLFETIEQQSFKDFEVIVSDHSVGNAIIDLCTSWKQLNIRYIRNERSRGSCEANLNNAIRHAGGKYIKPMLQDDFFLDDHALDKLTSVLMTDQDWSAGGCMHCREDNTEELFQPHSPQWIPNDSLALGYNRIGSPSVVLYPKSFDNHLFDENLLWLMDCELYYRIGQEAGPPICIPDHLHVIRFRHDSISDSEVNDDIRGEEYHYVIEKIRGPIADLSKYPLIYRRAQELGLQ